MADLKTPLEIIEELVASGTTNIKKIVPGEVRVHDLKPGQVVIWEGKLDDIETRILEAAASDVSFADWMNDFSEDGEF